MIFVANGTHVTTLLHSLYIGRVITFYGIVHSPVVQLQILADSGSTQMIPVILFFPEGRGVSVWM